MALDPSVFCDPKEFDDKCLQFEAWVRSHAGPGVQVSFPGDRGELQRAANLKAGVPIHRDIVAQLSQLDVPLPPAC